MKPVLAVRVGSGSARAELIDRSHVLWGAESAFANPAELQAALAQLGAGEGMPRRASRIRVQVEPPLVQVRSLHDLPPVRTAHLKALVATQAARFFRRNGSPLVTDAAWHGARAPGAVAVAAAVEEPWISAIQDGSAAGGMPLDAICPAGLPAGVRLELLSPDEQRRRRRRERLALRRLAGAAAVAWLAAGAVWGIRFEREQRSVEAEIERLRSPAAAIVGARRALADATELVDSLERVTHQRRALLGRLAALSVGLPDSAYATSLAIDSAGAGELSVVARRSAEAMAALDQVRGIASPRVEGTVLREAAASREWERFAVRFEVVP